MAMLMALSAAGPAMAQTPTGIDSITVVAPRITYQVKREGGSVLPTEVTVARMTALVKFDDLDLRQTADLYKLEKRVDVAAAKVCADLAAQFPDGTPSTATCTRRAVDDAMAQVQQAARQANGMSTATARDEGN